MPYSSEHDLLWLIVGLKHTLDVIRFIRCTRRHTDLENRVDRVTEVQFFNNVKFGDALS